MVSENERLDIGKAYYKDGYKDAKIEDAKVLVSKQGMSIEEACNLIGLSIEDFKAL